MTNAERSKRLYQKRKDAGLCVDCGGPELVTKTQCATCREKRSQSRKRFVQRKNGQSCTNSMCTKDRIPGMKTCKQCSEKRKQKRLDRLTNGLCPACNNPNPSKKGYCDRCTETKRRRRQQIRQQVINHYGNECSCCQESTPLLLTIDHVDGDGANHRRQVTNGRSGIRFYRWLLSQGFPDGYQVLCWNCNAGKHLNGGICPHKEKEGA